MSDTPEIIYLIPGEYDGEAGLVWCEDPAPDEHCDPADAVEYVRKDKHQEIIDRQAKAALTGMDAAKQHALSAERNAKRLLAESNPAAIESERAANAMLTGEIDQARQIITDLVEYAECNDPSNPHIGRAKGFLSGGDDA